MWEMKTAGENICGYELLILPKKKWYYNSDPANVK